MIRFDDRVALITEAGRGIGFAYAKALAFWPRSLLRRT